MEEVEVGKFILESSTGLDAIKRAPIIIEETGIKCLRIGDISNSKEYKDWGNTKVKTEDYLKAKVELGDILIARTGNTIGCNKYIDFENKKVVFNNGLIRIKVKKEKAFSKYIYYCFQTDKYRKYIESIAYGTSTQPNMKIKDLLAFKVPNFNLETQKRIVSILASLDEKIKLNRKINQNLEEIAQTLFKRWFIDFEFPNEEGKPYKSSGGKMIKSELGEIPEGWRVGKLGEIIEIFDSLRKPLSKKERDLKEKLYPYYGAAGIIDYVDEYLFDGEYILLGEDGTVVSEKGTPILNFIQEKFWVSNHAHVIIEKNKDNSYLYYLLKNTDIRHIITGAVQPKINQKNLIELKVTISQEELVKKFSNIISNITLKIRNNQKEIKKLTELRDYLLPRLMSGEISV